MHPTSPSFKIMPLLCLCVFVLAMTLSLFLKHLSLFSLFHIYQLSPYIKSNSGPGTDFFFIIYFYFPSFFTILSFFYSQPRKVLPSIHPSPRTSLTHDIHTLVCQDILVPRPWRPRSKWVRKKNTRASSSPMSHSLTTGNTRTGYTSTGLRPTGYE